MNELLPTYQLQAFSGPLPAAAEVYFPDYSAPRPRIPLHRPYRGDYYKISLCLRGTAELKVNLETHVVGSGCLVLATPDVIKQWLAVSEDYETLTIFFTQDFITTHNAATGRLRFLVDPINHVLQLSTAEAENVAASFRFLQQKYHTPHAQRDNILKNIINCLPHEIGPLYDQPATALPVGTTRSQQLAATFRQLVQTHCTSARSVQFYAAQLCITPRHLNELVKAVTGRTASYWIAEAVALEAKALLENPGLPIQQVAASLHFADQFAFSRFFKKKHRAFAYRLPAGGLTARATLLLQFATFRPLPGGGGVGNFAVSSQYLAPGACFTQRRPAGTGGSNHTCKFSCI